MSNIDKQALREAANAANTASWGNWEPYKPHKGARGYEVKVGLKAVAQHCLKVDSVFIAAANPATVLALLDELEAKDKRIAELSASHGKLREAMAGIHNTIRSEGVYTPLAAILNASKRAYEESAAAAAKGEAS
ncbi:ead/Ea22-like family protein [Enterobacter cloacae]|uniref:ead/Ea22-like family protein n=1 Tax=Enterobacter cloacae TaxID=550 RepID=UPI00254D5F0A|nr:ead/Ea22-like family protein [Enterobacter cloacae]MDV5632677.1 ead/Ea22-like family protein [Enterobacter cloacae]MDV5670648.1 ead/Ea22-like family protein [Enterobacter cloacae]